MYFFVKLQKRKKQRQTYPEEAQKPSKLQGDLWPGLLAASLKRLSVNFPCRLNALL